MSIEEHLSRIASACEELVEIGVQLLRMDSNSTAGALSTKPLTREQLLDRVRVLNADEIRAELRKRGTSFGPRTSKKKLVAMLHDQLVKEAEERGELSGDIDTRRMTALETVEAAKEAAENVESEDNVKETIDKTPVLEETPALSKEELTAKLKKYYALHGGKWLEAQLRAFDPSFIRIADLSFEQLTKFHIAVEKAGANLKDEEATNGGG